MRDRPTGSAGVAVVTGGAAGIGRGIVERLLAADWTVWVLDLNAPTSAADSDVSHLHYRRCDLRHSDEVIDASTRIATATEAIDALVCSAGVAKVGELERTSIADTELMLAVNVLAVADDPRSAAPVTQERQ